jgi:Partial alpha/beta-hydrolase lipase region
MDVGYYAQLVGLKSEDVKVETEDGFILTVQHIIDVRPGAPDWKRLFPHLTSFDARKISSAHDSRIDAIVGGILCQRRRFPRLFPL